jgi:ribosomal protein L7Ae-like RNA K-turn-binding protein
MNSRRGSKAQPGMPEASGAGAGWGTLGLAMRAGALRLGSDATLQAIRTRRARLVLLASDAGPNTDKKFRDKCAFYHIPLIRALDRKQLGRACGRDEVVVAAVIHPGFAQALLKHAGNTHGGEVFDKTEGL